MEKITFNITGMTCSACQSRIENTVSNLSGIKLVNVNLLKNTMQVCFDPTLLSPQEIITAVKHIGYSATYSMASSPQYSPATNPTTSLNMNQQVIKKRLIISCLFTIPLFYLTMGSMLGLPIPSFLSSNSHVFSYAFTQLLLVLPVIFVNFNYYKNGFKALFDGAPNMNSLIGIGSGAAIIYSIYTLYKVGAELSHSHLNLAIDSAMNLYFESAAMILTLITAGKYIEGGVKDKTSAAITNLINLMPKTTTILAEGQEKIISCDEVIIGDILIIKSGERIPVDGIIIKGSGLIDQSSITGESIPLEKQEGDQVMSASLNQSGYFLMRVTKIGENTTLSQIIRLVDEATSSKPPIAKLADKISGIFIPIVIFIALIALISWLLVGASLAFALSIAIAILVISCPCALGLATPTAIMVGTGIGATQGVLFKSAAAIQTTQQIDTVILDKTGTITEGKPQVTDIVCEASSDPATLLFIAASLEKMSEHPIAQAIIAAFIQQKVNYGEVSDYQTTSGYGISGLIEQQRYFIGNLRFMLTQQIRISSIMQQKANTMAIAGKTVLFVANSTHLLGFIAVADVIKATSRQAITELIHMGIDVHMFTGDNNLTASAIQKQVNIQQVRAELLPQDKALQIRELQQQGKKVAMIGDGINDAPALASADMGMAIGTGADIAIESADIILIKSDLLDAVTAIQLSKAVMNNIRQNLFWAFFYNIISIPFAAGVFYSLWHITLNPMIAAMAMSLSSVTIIANALRLRLFKPQRQPAFQQLKKTSTLTDSIDNQLFTKRIISMKKQINIEGMTCQHCCERVKKALNSIPGVIEVVIDLSAKSATVNINEDVTMEALTTAITEVGYEVSSIQ
ncbi:MAG: heavy metal translocating P-type ATPase [Candidatus Schmidhempelia sp.]|nr:heavy metal translocating P-type ATPase [Candidatus Schmidhempelia sp.]